jgi:hypothetical protein
LHERYQCGAVGERHALQEGKQPTGARAVTPGEQAVEAGAVQGAELRRVARFA